MKLITLASILESVAQAGESVESKADSILSILKTAGVKDLEAFNEQVKAAYTANGWNSAQGNPGSNATGSNVPATVKQYVSQVRAGFRLGLPMASFKTIHALRKAIKAKAPTAQEATDDPILAGVRVANRRSLIGAPFHDLAAVYSNLPKEKQARLVRAIKSLVTEYGTKPHLRLAA